MSARQGQNVDASTSSSSSSSFADLVEKCDSKMKRLEKKRDDAKRERDEARRARNMAIEDRLKKEAELEKVAEDSYLAQKLELAKRLEEEAENEHKRATKAFEEAENELKKAAKVLEEAELRLALEIASKEHFTNPTEITKLELETRRSRWEQAMRGSFQQPTTGMLFRVVQYPQSLVQNKTVEQIIFISSTRLFLSLFFFPPPFCTLSSLCEDDDWRRPTLLCCTDTAMEARLDALQEAIKEVQARSRKESKEVRLLKRELAATKGTSPTTTMLGHEVIELMETIKLDELFVSNETNAVTTLWSKWMVEKSADLPQIGESELKKFQPILNDLATMLVENTAYKVFSNKAMGKGDFRPDIAITSILEDHLHFRFLTSCFELKSTIEDATLRIQALGQCRRYLSKAALHQPKRDLFIGAITDLRTIRFLGMKRVEDEPEFKYYFTPPEALLPERKDDYNPHHPTPGFAALVRLFRTTREGLGFHDPLLRESVMFQQQNIQLGNRMGAGGTSTVYKAFWNGQEVAIKIANSKKVFVDMKNEAKVLRAFEEVPGEKVPHMLGFDSATGVIIMKPVGRTLNRYAEEQYEEDSLRADYFSIAKYLVFNLEEIHKKGYLHLDIRPSNIVLLEPKTFGKLKDWKNAVVLIDWGLAMPEGSTVSFVSGVPAYQASEWLSAALNSKDYTLSIYDDLESAAYCLFDMLSEGLPWVKAGLNNQKILEHRKSILFPSQISDYLDCLREMRKNQKVDYSVLGRVIFAGKSARDNPSSPLTLPKRCVGTIKYGIRCQRSSTRGSSYCFEHNKQISVGELTSTSSA